MADMTLPSARGDMTVYSATPSRPGPWPGVVLIHDAFGLTRVAREHSDWLASEGFLTAAPKLFEPRGMRHMISCVKAAMKEIAERRGPMFDDVETTRSWLAKQPGCSGRIGVIGFCMGGGFAIALAPGRGFSASSVNYGRLPDDAETYLTGACPVIGSFGAKDSSLRGVAGRLEKILTAQNVPHDVKEYPDCGHSFLEDHRRGEVPTLFLMLGRFFHAGFHEPSARDAQARILAFFDKHLRT